MLEGVIFSGDAQLSPLFLRLVHHEPCWHIMTGHMQKKNVAFETFMNEDAINAKRSSIIFLAAGLKGDGLLLAYSGSPKSRG